MRCTRCFVAGFLLAADLLDHDPDRGEVLPWYLTAHRLHVAELREAGL